MEHHVQMPVGELLRRVRPGDREALEAICRRAWEGDSSCLNPSANPASVGNQPDDDPVSLGNGVRAFPCVTAGEGCARPASPDFQLLFEKMVEGFALHEIICDARGEPVDYRFLAVNMAFEKLTRLKREDVIGRTVLEVLPGIEPFWIQTYGRVALGGEAKAFEHFDSITGHLYEVTAFCPCPGQFACVFSDTTNRKSARQELRASRRRLQDIIQTTPAGYYFIGRDGCFRHVNPAWLKMHGYSSVEEVVGLHFRATQVASSGAAAQAVVDRVLAGESISAGNFPRRLKDGTVGWHSFTIKPVVDEGEIIGLEGFLIDTTQAKAAEEAILRSQAELEAIYDGTPIMMCLVNQNYQVERMNRSLAEFIGQSARQTPLLGLGDLIQCANSADYSVKCGEGPNCHVCRLRHAMAETFLTGKPNRQIESRMFLRRQSGLREISVYASTSLVQIQGEPKVILCLEDVTLHRQLELQLLQARKMEAVGELAGGVAHDFNNILAATMLHLGILQLKAGVDPEILAGLKEMEQGVQRATSLTRQLLLFSRRQVIETQRLDLNRLILDLSKMLRRLLGEHISLTFDPSAESAWVEADPGMMEQVVMNLCVNARDAMPKGGPLNLRTSPVTLESRDAGKHPDSRPGDFIRLEVTDAGSGMDAATLERIFEPFFTTKEPGKGTGLGLATVYGIARQHRGWVEVRSEPGCGSTFEVFLPVSAPGAHSDEVEPDPQLPQGSETILLVEDDDQVRRLVCSTLKLHGYRVIEATNGIEALRCWDESGGSPSLLFSDMIMPGGMTGLDVAERLCQLKPALRVIISSGYSPDLLNRNEFGVEGIQFLSKPYNLNTLAEFVRNCLDGKR